MKVSSKWTDQQGRIFIVASVQDGVVFYISNENTYACSVEAFRERFKELAQ
jgi:hypothetical protein